MAQSSILVNLSEPQWELLYSFNMDGALLVHSVWHYMDFSSLYRDYGDLIASSTRGLDTKVDLVFAGNYS